eukprot:TRINITY_DN618_c0_g1_i2.p1 TRINITY_DN618_c0_g1~~TRINITY_DN618_c0_g1_i2.p1  ORF type:complete len:196 (-),score=16.64 TRINITY_DN618_c0_g1_i2:15-602(-)
MSGSETTGWLVINQSMEQTGQSSQVTIVFFSCCRRIVSLPNQKSTHPNFSIFPTDKFSPFKMMFKCNPTHPKTILGFSLMLCVGLVLNILACVLHNNWLPIIIVLTYLLAPLPNVMCPPSDPNGYVTSSHDYGHVGEFLTGALLVSGFGLPLVLLHAEQIGVEAFLLGLFGGLIVYGTVVVWIKTYHDNKDEFSY